MPVFLIYITIYYNICCDDLTENKFVNSNLHSITFKDTFLVKVISDKISIYCQVPNHKTQNINMFNNNYY